MSVESIAYRFRKVSYSIILIGVGFLLMTASFLTPSTDALSLDLQARDCDNNAVIHCGAASTEELIRKYNNQADVRAIFSHFGISPQEMRQIGSTAVAGVVTRDGNVEVNGKVVATGAMTAGRQNMSGSNAVSAGGTQFYMRSPSTSFQSGRLKAFVVMTDTNRNNTGGAPANNNRDDNSGKRFAFAIIASCGNPVKAQPKEQPKPAPTKPEKPKEQPKPQTLQPEKRPEIKAVPAPQQQQQQQQSQSQQQSTTVTVTPPQPQPETKTVIERVEVPVPVAVQQPAQAAPAPVQELPKTGMESVSSTLGIAGLATVLGAVAHLLYTRRKLIRH